MTVKPHCKTTYEDTETDAYAYAYGFTALRIRHASTRRGDAAPLNGTQGESARRERETPHSMSHDLVERVRAG